MKDLAEAQAAMVRMFGAMSRELGELVPENERDGVYQGAAIATGIPAAQIKQMCEGTAEQVAAAVLSGQVQFIAGVRGACLTCFLTGVNVGEQKP